MKVTFSTLGLVLSVMTAQPALALVFKLAQAAEKSWRRLDGHHHLPKVIRGIKFTNGIEVVSQKTQAAAA